MLKFILNNELITTNIHPSTLLIDFIRENIGLKGTKEACREGECGACTVLIGRLCEDNIKYETAASCILPVGETVNCHIVTVEGLNEKKLNLIQEIIVDQSASQCGFCTPGIILSLTGFSLSDNEPTYRNIINSLDGNICRCTGYSSIKKSAQKLLEVLIDMNTETNDKLGALVSKKIIPEYFLDIRENLKSLNSNKDSTLEENDILIAGGTDLFVQKPVELLEKQVYFLSARKDLEYIKENNVQINIGALINVENFRRSEIINKYYPQMDEILLNHSSTIIRNKATITGNIVNASPIGDMTIILLALNAKLSIECKGGSLREVFLSDFFKGYKEFDLSKCEIIKEIIIPKPENKYIFNFEKVSNRKVLDIASVNTAFFTELKDNKIKKIRISAGGVSPVPYFVKDLDKFYNMELKDDVFESIVNHVLDQVKPIDDIRGTAEYKKLLLKQLLMCHFNKFLLCV